LILQNKEKADSRACWETQFIKIEYNAWFLMPNQSGLRL